MSDHPLEHPMKVRRGWHIARNVLYTFIALSAVLSVGFFAAYISLRSQDELFSSYLAAGLELVVAGALVLVILLPWRFLLCRRNSASVLGGLIAELAIVSVLALLFLGGLVTIQIKRSLYYQSDGVYAVPKYDWGTETCYTPRCRFEKAAMGSSWATFALLVILLAFLFVYGISHHRVIPRVWYTPFGAPNTTTTGSYEPDLPVHSNAEPPLVSSGMLVHRVESDVEKGDAGLMKREERVGHNVI